jgi:hypothetical protein
MTALQHADEDDGMPHRLPTWLVKIRQRSADGDVFTGLGVAFVTNGHG